MHATVPECGGAFDEMCKLLHVQKIKLKYFFVQQLQPSRLVQTAAMKQGVEMERRAAFIYAYKDK